ncbi:MAG: apolipoprotein N-acyltransferase [Deltaproteobacteria bacterium]|nr:apolipoprotein N-acyltransferase [Deltaproteobacteria bacterium]
MKKSLLLLLASAGALIASFAPISIFPLAWVAIVPLLFALEGKGKRGAFLTGLVWGLIFFTGTVYWVVHSMYYFGGVPIPIGVAVLALLALYMSLYPALFALAFSVARTGNPILQIIAASSLWVGLEYLRGYLLTGFPWVALGYSQTPFTSIIQVADIAGVGGVSFILVAFNTALYLAIKKFVARERVPLALYAALICIVAAPLIYGELRRAQVEKLSKDWQKVRVGIAQGNFDQSIKWDPSRQQETIEVYRDLSLNIAGRRGNLILWPETAIPFYLQLRDSNGEMVLETARKTESHIITGSPAYRRGEGGVEYFNSAFLISPEGEMVGRYDKVHLVPFGEYVPLKRLLFFIKKLTVGVGDFSSGTSLTPLTLKTASGEGSDRSSVGVLICFESIFPKLARGMVGNGANLLAVITNDGWFGRTSAPYQHFDIAVFRAVENRSFLLRAANTGVSGIVNPTGRIITKSSLFTRTTLVEDVGLRTAPLTFYTRYGDLFSILCLITSLIILPSILLRKRHDSD